MTSLPRPLPRSLVRLASDLAAAGRSAPDALPDPLRRRFALGLLAGPAIVALPGCGGGIGEGGTGSAPTFTAGSINGFGSVIVADVAFDESAASIVDGDGTGRSRSELRLGMTVEVDAGEISNGSATATRIRFDSALLGPVSALDTSGGFVVLGQRVATDELTVFDDALATRRNGLRLGEIVEVYGEFDPALGRLRATRVELRAVAVVYRVRGVVEQLDAADQTLRIGTAVFSFPNAGGRPADLAVGRFVRLTLSPNPISAGRWTVIAFGTPLRSLAEVGDLEDARLRGLVTALTSAASFQVDGRPVDATGATVSAGPVVLGARVDVQGTVRGGVLRARSVQVRSDAFERDRGFDLRGAIEAVTLVARSFVLRGFTISVARADLRLEGGTLADLQVGRQVEVRGQLSLVDQRIEAVRIVFR
jgi:hypothetical protein